MVASGVPRNVKNDEWDRPLTLGQDWTDNLGVLLGVHGAQRLGHSRHQPHHPMLHSSLIVLSSPGKHVAQEMLRFLLKAKVGARCLTTTEVTG